MVDIDIGSGIESIFGFVLNGALYWGPLAIFWLVSSRWLLAEFGAERLFWEERPSVQFGALLNTGIFVAVTLYTWRLVDEPHFLMTWLHQYLPSWMTLAWGTEDKTVLMTGTYLFAAMIAYGLLLFGQKIFQVVFVEKSDKKLRYLIARRYFLPGLVGYLASMLVVVVFCYFESKCYFGELTIDTMRVTQSKIQERYPNWKPFESFLGNLDNELQDNDLNFNLGGDRHYVPWPSYAQPLHELAGGLMMTSLIIGSLVLAAIVIWRRVNPRQVISSPVVIVAQVGIFVVQLLGFTAFHITTPMLLLAIGGTVLVLWNMQSLRWAKYRFAGLDKYYDDPSPLATYPSSRPIGGTPNLLDDHKVLTTHLALLPPGQKKLVLLAVSGGGIRAAVWIPVVLEGIRKEFREFDQHVRIIAGASGGMVGAALDVASRGLPNSGIPLEDANIGLGMTSGMTATQSLLPVIQTMVIHDLFLNMIFPFGGIERERGRELELQWALVASERFPKINPWDRSFDSLMESEKQAAIPSLVITPTTVEDTRRVIISNLDLGDIAESHGPRLGTGVSPYSRSSLELFKLFPLAQKEMPLRTAARMNATFPIVSPNVSLPTDPPRRLVDAGLYDNYGVGFLASWMFKNRETLMSDADGVLIVEIRAFPMHKDGEEFARESGGILAVLSGFLGIITNPLKGLIRGRGNIMFHRNNSGLAGVAETFSDDAVNQYRAWKAAATGQAPEIATDFFQTLSIELDEDAALNWYLSGIEKAAIAGFWKNHFARRVEKQIDQGVEKDVVVPGIADHIRQWLGYPPPANGIESQETTAPSC